MMEEFKAGDFTSGKMGEIFKECFMGEEQVAITHKQFGKAYLVPEDEIRLAVINKFRALGLEINHTCSTVDSVKELALSIVNKDAQTSSCVKHLEFDTWLDVLKVI